MSFYVKSPFKASPTLMVQGKPEYVFGSYNDKCGPTLGNVVSDSAVTTTATLTFQIISGNAPQVGSLITVVGAANSPNFNATNAQILTASTTAGGICTVTYAITSTSQGTLPDGGQVIVPQPELGDALTTTVASVPVCTPLSPGTQSGKSISVTVKLPSQQLGVSSTLSGVTVTIQGANLDADDQYNDIGTVVTGGAAGSDYDWQSGQGANKSTGTGVLAEAAVNIPNFRFLRLNVSAVTGSGPIIGTITF